GSGLKSTPVGADWWGSSRSGTDGNHPAARREKGRRRAGPSPFLGSGAAPQRSGLVERPTLHSSGDGDELPGDVTREDVRGEDHDLDGDVLWLRDLAQGHRPGDAPNVVGVDASS